MIVDQMPATLAWIINYAQINISFRSQRCASLGRSIDICFDPISTQTLVDRSKQVFIFFSIDSYFSSLDLVAIDASLHFSFRFAVCFAFFRISCSRFMLAVSSNTMNHSECVHYRLSIAIPIFTFLILACFCCCCCYCLNIIQLNCNRTWFIVTIRVFSYQLLLVWNR